MERSVDVNTIIAELIKKLFVFERLEWRQLSLYLQLVAFDFFPAMKLSLLRSQTRRDEFPFFFAAFVQFLIRATFMHIESGSAKLTWIVESLRENFDDKSTDKRLHAIA